MFGPVVSILKFWAAMQYEKSTTRSTVRISHLKDFLDPGNTEQRVITTHDSVCSSTAQHTAGWVGHHGSSTGAVPYHYY
jgi:hypothetical protein